MDKKPTVCIVDDDRKARRAATALAESMHLAVDAYASADEFLVGFDPSGPGCLLLEAQMSGIDALDLLERLLQHETCPPVIVISTRGDVPTVVRAMKAGAADFLLKPCPPQRLRQAIAEALQRDAENRKRQQRTARIRRRIDRLTAGERDVLRMLTEGKSNKNMATLLGLSVRAIEARRAKVMRKMKARSLAELVRLALLAGVPSTDSREPRPTLP